MTMMNKMKKSKKGFTLVELVIVIAILAILSAIVIPLISTTINAAKISVMESDCETLDMVVKECMSNAVACNRTEVYGRSGVTAALATVGDVCYTNQLDVDSSFFTRTFDNTTYQMVYYKGAVCISGGTKNCGTPAPDVDRAGSNGCVVINAATAVTQLSDEF